MENNQLINETEEQEKRKIISNQRKLRILNIVYVRFFIFLLYGFFVISLIIPLRPKYSESEKRELARFPKFTASSFFSGKFFEGIGEWYSDTFTFRETLTELNARVTGLYGKTDTRIHGTVEKGDDIPEAGETASSDLQDSSSEQAGAETAPPETAESSSAAEPPKEKPAEPAPAEPTTQTLGALLINGDTAYEYYNFVRETADAYTAAVNRAGQLLNGSAAVYDIIVPTSMGITAPDELTAAINTSDQQKAINYMYSCIGSAKTVPVYDILKAHKDEYIYFRTDHHWTALGAYYAYYSFMQLKGETPTVLADYGQRQFPGYLGSFYTSSGKLPQLAANPDTVFAYQPKETNTAEIHYENGAVANGDIISDMSGSSSKYLTFIKGDRPLEVINNPARTDGSACIVIKESFGNAFVPFLVSHYNTVYVVDYRYFSKIDGRGLVQLCADTGAKEVLFINNISATRNKTLVADIDSFVR